MCQCRVLLLGCVTGGVLGCVICQLALALALALVHLVHGVLARPQKGLVGGWGGRGGWLQWRPQWGLRGSGVHGAEGGLGTWDGWSEGWRMD